MAVMVAVAVNTDGRREILGVTVMPSEAETFWAEFLRSLTRRGLRGVQLVISDAHEGLKAAARKVLSAGWQRCRVHFQRNLLARVGKTNKPVEKLTAVAALVQSALKEDPFRGGTREGRVLSRLSPGTPSSRYRFCQRQTVGFDMPVRRMISTVP